MGSTVYLTPYESYLEDWQESQRWRQLMASLTMPTPSSPSPVKVGRDHAKLKWTTKYVPPAVDRTRFGFRIMTCRTEESYDCFESALFRGDGSLEEPDPSAEGTFSARIALPLSNTEYRCRYNLLLALKFLKGIRIAMFYGIGGSETHFSEWSQSFRSLNHSYPEPIRSLKTDYDARSGGILLKFVDPEDDGGMDILGYSVYAKYSDDYLLRSWHLISTHFLNHKGTEITRKGGVTSFLVQDMIPDVSFRLKVSCFNNLGESQFSQQSTELRLFKPKKNSIANSNGLYLDDEKEVIIAHPCSSKRANEFEVWSSHRPSSPHSVINSRVFVDEQVKTLYDASVNGTTTCFRRSPSPAGSIAIVARSGEPILSLVLRMQVQVVSSFKVKVFIVL